MVLKPKMIYKGVEQPKHIGKVGFRMTRTKPTSSDLSPKKTVGLDRLVKLMRHYSENNNPLHKNKALLLREMLLPYS